MDTLTVPESRDVSESTDLVIFKAITTFVSELSNLYGDDNPPLFLYQKLVVKTKVVHVEPIRKHIIAFKTWLSINSDAIKTRDVSLLKDTPIKYSDKVYIDIKNLMLLSELDIQTSIWKHIHVIKSLLEGTKGREKGGKSCENEQNFMKNVMKKIESSIDPNTMANLDPNQAMGYIMNSGILTNLISDMNTGISSGQLDTGKLLSMTSGLLSTLQQDIKMN
jgi:hypothetical protein